MTWHRKILRVHKAEMMSSALLTITVVFAIMVWYFALGKSFEWTEINPISEPSLLDRTFYSAFAFLTFGAFLYYGIRFYRGLHFIFIEALGDWRSYKAIKALIWLVLMGMSFYVVGKIVDVLNAGLSFLYNIVRLILYLAPPVGIAIAVSVIVYSLIKRES